MRGSNRAGAYLPFVVKDAKKVYHDDCEYLLVLGGLVIGEETPSDHLLERIHAAADYLKENTSCYVIPCGGCFRDGQKKSETFHYEGGIKEYVQQYPSAQYFEGQRPWSVKCDIAMPCATQNELNEEEAKTLLANGCMCVAEGANMPTTPGAIAAFQSAKILYSPGKASNAGGVATSGLEMTQNSMRLRWTPEEVDQQLKRIMTDIHEACVKYGTEADGYVNYVKGANIAGFIKVAEAMMAQGLV